MSRSSLATTRLSVAGGSYYGYFGHDEWRQVAREVKSLESALAVRAHILSSFEAAELETDPERREAWLTFVVVDGGPTGVEMAGQIAELARDTLRREFRSTDPTKARVLLVETQDRVLTGFPPSLSDKAARALEHLGVTLMLGRTVVDIDHHSVTTEDAQKRRERIPTRTVIGGDGLIPRPRPGRDHRSRRGPGRPHLRRRPTSPCPATLRCSPSATWFGCSTRSVRPRTCPGSRQ